MFKTFKIALFSLLIAGNTFAEDAYLFQDTGNWEQFSWGRFSTKDLLLSGPSSVVIKPLDSPTNSGTELYLTLLGKANYISVTDFSSDSQVAFLRVTTDKLADEEKHNFTCEIGTYSQAKGIKIVEAWQTKREYYESSSNCSVGAKFLSDGSLAYVKRTDSQIVLNIVAESGARKEIFVKNLPTDFAGSYGFDSLPIENPNTKTIVFQSFVGGGTLGTSVYYNLGASAVSLVELQSNRYLGQYSTFKLFDNNDIATSFGVVGPDGTPKSKPKRHFIPNFYSAKQDLYFGDGVTSLVNEETAVVSKDGNLLPLECITGQVPKAFKINSILDERADGTLLVTKEDKDYVGSVALLKFTGSPLVNTRCIEITHDLSKDCSSAYRRQIVANSYSRKAKQLPKSASCNLNLRVKKPSGEPFKGIKGNVILTTGSRIFKRFSTNAKGKAQIILPMRALAKNEETVTVNVFGRGEKFQNLTITIDNYSH